MADHGRRVPQCSNCGTELIGRELSPAIRRQLRSLSGVLAPTLVELNPGTQVTVLLAGIGAMVAWLTKTETDQRFIESVMNVFLHGVRKAVIREQLNTTKHAQSRH